MRSNILERDEYNETYSLGGSPDRMTVRMTCSRLKNPYCSNSLYKWTSPLISHYLCLDCNVSQDALTAVDPPSFCNSRECDKSMSQLSAYAPIRFDYHLLQRTSMYEISPPDRPRHIGSREAEAGSFGVTACESRRAETAAGFGSLPLLGSVIGNRQNSRTGP